MAAKGWPICSLVVWADSPPVFYLGTEYYRASLFSLVGMGFRARVYLLPICRPIQLIGKPNGYGGILARQRY